MNKIGLILAGVLSLAGKAYSAQLNRQEIDRVVADALPQQRNIHAEITPDFVRGIILTESNGDTEARSRAGARGLMQIMPATWSDVTTADYDTQAFDAQTNVNVGIRYLNWLADYASRNNPDWSRMDREQRQDTIAAMYNGGPNALRRRGWIISMMSRETRDYVPRVRARARSNPPS